MNFKTLKFLSHCAVRRHGSVGCSAVAAICCSVVAEDEDVVEEEEEDSVVGDETDSALSCFFWHFSCFPIPTVVFAGFPDGGGDGDCFCAGPRCSCTQEKRV